MSKLQHTPGPWKGDLNVDEDQFNVYPDTGKMEFPICIMPDFIKPDLNAANARLIAAAPELLEAAEKALQALEGVDALMHKHGMMQGVNCPAIAPLRAAILSAKGEEE